MKNGTKIAICLGTAALTFVLAAFAQTLLIPLTALSAYMGAMWGLYYLAPSAIAACAGALLFGGTDPGSLAAAAMFLLIYAVLTAYLKKKFPHRYAVLALAVTVCVGQYLSMTIASMLAGRPPYSDVVDAWDRMVSEVFTPVFGGIAGGGEVLSMFGDVSAAIPDTLMFMCILTAEGVSTALVMLTRLLHRLFKTEPAPMARFAEWRLPHTALIGGGIMLVCIALAYIFRLEQANSVAYSLGLIVASLFAVQGMAYLDFVFRVSRAPGFVRVLAWVLPVLAFPYSLLLLAFIGVKEQITKKRPKVKKYLMELSAQQRAMNRADELAKYGYVRQDAKKPPEDGESNNGGGDGSAGTDKGGNAE